MTNQPPANGQISEHAVFTARWFIEHPADNKPSGLVLSAARHHDFGLVTSGPMAHIPIDTLPFPITDHHFVPYMLSLMVNTIDEIENFAERVCYPKRLRHIQGNLIPGYFPRMMA